MTPATAEAMTCADYPAMERGRGGGEPPACPGRTARARGGRRGGSENRRGRDRSQTARGGRRDGGGGVVRGVFLAAAVAVLIAFLLTAPTDAAGRRNMTFLPQWLPQAQFAGYYVAYEKGFYQEEGIDLRILKGGPDSPPAAMLAEGRTDFTTMFLSEALQQRDKRIPLVNIGQIMQRSGFILVAKKARGITKPADLNHKKISLWPNFQVQPQAFFRKYGLNVNVVVQGATVNLFLRGGVDAASAMWYNEYHSIINAGVNEEELTAFFFDRHGLNFPEDGIYALKETCERDPEGCRRFVRASRRGWEYAFAHPEEATDIVMKYIHAAHGDSNRVHQQWMLKRLKELIKPGDGKVPIGALNPDDYKTVAAELRKSGLIKSAPPFGEFHVPCLEKP